MSEPKNIRIWARLLKPIKHSDDRAWLTVVAFFFLTVLVCMWVYKWQTLPCSSFKTNPVLRHGYAPARCLNE